MPHLHLHHLFRESTTLLSSLRHRRTAKKSVTRLKGRSVLASFLPKRCTNESKTGWTTKSKILKSDLTSQT